MMRIATWNMNQQGQAVWDYLWDTVQPDIALLQEAIMPSAPSSEYSALWTPGWKDGRWGSAIVSRVGKLTIVWDDNSRGATLLASADVPGLGSISVASIHARIIEHRVIPALRATFDELRKHLTERFIVGGDLNTARNAALAWPGNGHGEFWTDVEGWGFREPLPPSGERQSFWREWRQNKIPTIGNSLQDDHIFLDERTLEQAKQCRVWDTREIRELSDHGPVVVDLDL